MVRVNKPYKRDGIWLFGDGTVIPDQARAAQDVRYRETTNSLMALVTVHAGKDQPSVADVEAARIRLGWDSPKGEPFDLDTAIESLSERLGLNDFEAEYAESVARDAFAAERDLVSVD